MAITPQRLMEFAKQLDADRAKLSAQLPQVQASISAYNGALKAIEVIMGWVEPVADEDMEFEDGDEYFEEEYEDQYTAAENPGPALSEVNPNG